MRIRRHRAAASVVIAVLALAPSAPGAAEGPVPEPCKLHPTHVVNPGCVPAATSELREPGITLPNITPDVRTVAIGPRFVFDEETMTYVEDGRELRFDGWVQNTGTVPLELVADDPNNPTTATQCIRWTNRVCREYREVGEYAWHDEHSHFHFQDFADYRLRRLAPDGRPDYSDEGVLRVSEKVSYCLVDSALADITKPSAPFYLSCGPTLQGVSAGWADVYGTTMDGQSFPIDGLPDGHYALVVAMDYGNRLLETDDTDNVVELTVEISGGGAQATIIARHHP
jgi:hypothetical protein